MNKTIQNIHRTCISHASAIREKLEASEAEVARLKEALKHVAGEALDSYRRVALLGEEVNKLRGKPESVKPYEQYRFEPSQIQICSVIKK